VHPKCIPLSQMVYIFVRNPLKVHVFVQKGWKPAWAVGLERLSTGKVHVLVLWLLDQSACFCSARQVAVQDFSLRCFHATLHATLRNYLRPDLRASALLKCMDLFSDVLKGARICSQSDLSPVDRGKNLPKCRNLFVWRRGRTSVRHI
jgi:hypothetical protein